MTDPFASPDPFAKPASAPPSGYGDPAGYGGPAPYGAGPGYGAPAFPGSSPAGGPIGRVRGTGFGIALFVVTFGLYGLYWYFAVHDELKRHTGEGLGGPMALIISVVVGAASPFLTSHEVGQLYTRRGQPTPVTALTGLWVVPGALLLVLPIVWFVKTNGALNAYWRSLGAV